MSAAISAQDAHRLESLAHSLKGSAANVGADRFATHCSALEEAARSRVWSEVDGELAAARDEWRRVEPCLRAVAGALAGTRAGTILEEQPRESSDW